MTQHALLNNIEHQDLKVITNPSAELGDNVWYAPTFVDEFYSVQTHYPILFTKDNETGTFTPVALFGFKDAENLFLNDAGWQVNYIPISMRRLPFYIGTQNIVDEGMSQQQRVLTIDLDSPKVNKEEGQSLFLEQGGNSPYLENMANMLEGLHHGIAHNEHFIEALLALNLLEVATIEIKLSDGSNNQMHGFYVINEEALANLSDSDIAAIHKSGYLQAIYMIIASQANIQGLVDRKNTQLTTLT